MCEIASKETIRLVEETRIWKVIGPFSPEFHKGPGLRTGPCSNTLVAPGFMHAVYERGSKDPSPYAGFRCFLKKEDAQDYLNDINHHNNFAYFYVAPVIAIGEVRLATMKVWGGPHHGLAYHGFPAYRTVPVALVDKIKFEDAR